MMDRKMKNSQKKNLKFLMNCVDDSRRTAVEPSKQHLYLKFTYSVGK